MLTVFYLKNKLEQIDKANLSKKTYMIEGLETDIIKALQAQIPGELFVIEKYKRDLEKLGINFKTTEQLAQNTDIPLKNAGNKNYLGGGDEKTVLLRNNLINLLKSNNTKDITLAFQLIEGGGMHSAIEECISERLKDKEFIWHILNYPGIENILSMKTLLEQVKVLKLDNMSLIGLPASIGILKNLEILDCSKNNLTELPAEIGNLTNLKNIQCHNNQLTELPSNIGNLKNLDTLNLHDNQITYLPQSFSTLLNLKLLTCGKNQFVELSSKIKDLKNLEMIWCTEHSLSAEERTKMRKLLPKCHMQFQ